MDNIKVFYKTSKILLFIGLPFIIFLSIVLCFSNTSASNEAVVVSSFVIPFNEDVRYMITSNFGTRIDPLTKEYKFHSGVDLSAPIGTLVTASADGIASKIGYDENGLGNYIYLEHTYEDLKIYTMYGHLKDDSILVNENDIVTAHQALGTIGDTGRATGVHLHFMISKNKPSFNAKDLVNPILIINGKEELK